MVGETNLCRYPQRFQGYIIRPGCDSCDPFCPNPRRKGISFQSFLLSKPLLHSSTSYYKNSVCRCWFQAKGSNNTKNRVWHLLVVRSCCYGAVYNPQIMRVVSISFRVLPQVFPVKNRLHGIRRSVLRLICLMLTFPFLARADSAKSC